MPSRFEVITMLKRKRISTALAQGKREDGRGLMDFRKIVIKKG
ncbi:RNA-binding protein, partial [Candidatus Bathyarchaeota archaeon]